MENIQPDKSTYAVGIQSDIDAYLEEMRIRKYSGKSIQTRRYGLAKLKVFLAERGITRSSDVMREHMEQYAAMLTARGYKPHTKDAYIRGPGCFFRYLEESNRIFSDPMKDMVIGRVRKKLQPVPTKKEVSRLLNAPDISTSYGIRDRAMLEALYSCGLRLGELLGMKVFDPDFGSGTLRVLGKGNKERVVPMGRRAMRWLKVYVSRARPNLQRKDRDEDSMWLSKYGRVLCYSRVQGLVNEYSEKAGIETPVCAHALRRACVSHMLANGAHPVHIQMLLGHSTLKNLCQYLEVGLRDIMRTHARARPGG